MQSGPLRQHPLQRRLEANWINGEVVSAGRAVLRCKIAEQLGKALAVARAVGVELVDAGETLPAAE
jgi:hypothetical protein